MVLAEGGFKVKGQVSNCLEMKDVNQSDQVEKRSWKLFEIIQKVLSHF